MAEMSQPTRYAAIVMGGIFLLAGCVKLININNDVYTYMRDEFKKYAKVFPLRTMGIAPAPSTYMKTVGITEVISALLLIFGNTKIRKFAIFIMIALMVGAMQTLLCLKEFSQVLMPFCHLLILIWIIYSYDQDIKTTKVE